MANGLQKYLVTLLPLSLTHKSKNLNIMKVLMSLILVLSFGVTAFAQNTTPETTPTTQPATTTYTKPAQSDFGKTSQSTATAAPTATAAKPVAVTAPAAVKTTFDQKFPKASNVAWTKNNENGWEAKFTVDAVPVSAKFMNDGSWIETDRSINSSELPKAVGDAIKAQYPTWTIAKTSRTETAKKGVIYKATVKNANEKKHLAFNENGTAVTE